MNNSTNDTNSKTNSTTETTNEKTNTGYVEKTDTVVETSPKIESTDDNLDDLGYEKIPSEKSPVEAKPAEEEDPKVEKAATGYDDKPEETKPVEESKPAEEKPPGELTEEEKYAKEIAEVSKNLSDNYDKEKINKFAIEHKLTKAQLEAYVKLTKEDEAANIKRQEQLVKQQRNTWKTELKNDPEFGGENFIKNVDRVEKVLEKYLPDTKKVLTERGSMLPPYIMRDFLRLSKVLNPTTKLVTGESKEVKKEGNFLDEMYS